MPLYVPNVEPTFRIGHLCGLGALTEFWRRPILSSRFTTAVFWLSLLMICSLRAYIGLTGERLYSHDAFVLLDGAWRMLHGQRPHVDFNSVVGPAAYLPTIIGFRLSGNSVAGFGYGQAIAAFLIGAWAYFLSAGRLADVCRVAFSLCIAAVAVSPSQLGMSPFQTTPATTYNRCGYALLGLILLECVRRRRHYDFLDGLSTGVLLATLAFLKAPYFLAGTALLIALLRVRAQTKRRWAGMAFGLGCAGLAFLAYLRFRPDLVLSDLLVTAAAKHVLFFDIYDLNAILLQTGITLILGLGAAAWLRYEGFYDAGNSVARISGAIVCSSLFLIFCSYQPSELSLAPFLMILVIEAVIPLRISRESVSELFRSVVIAVSTAFIGVAMLSIALSMWFGLVLKTQVAPKFPSFDAPTLKSFVPVGPEAWYTQFVNDGIDLLRIHRHPGEHVMSLDFSNPFSYALEIPPAVGGATTLAFHGSFEDKHHVSPERLFGASELVMLPRQFSDGPLWDSIPRVYGPYLNGHYGFVAESQWWRLYRVIVPVQKRDIRPISHTSGLK